MAASPSSRILVGVDVGGTFTDFVVLQDGRLRVHKRATTPQDQSQAIVVGLEELGIHRAEIVHGTTVATNALLERRGASTALLTTQGFADVLVIGRQNRPALYRLHQRRPPGLVDDPWRLEVPERVGADGSVLLPLDEDAVRALARRMAQDPESPESIAVVLLFSFLNPEHERRVEAILREHLPDRFVSLSSEILPEYREYERTATTVINAYVRPLVARYLERLTGALPACQVRIMQSNGGVIGVDQAGSQAARLVLSGPAGGVVGAFALAQQATGLDDPNVITLDMGGTSTDVALCPGAVERTAESEIAGLPLRLPIIDIHTVGAGGGSLAYVDPGGSLRVGPQSAGAVPGPACYGRGGTQPTVTDANLVLGRLAPDQFLGGRGHITLDVEAARAALVALGQDLGGLSPEEAALGVVRVANATMERALRRVSVERGHDPREFVLIPFGGAGPLHGCDLADALQVRRILIPPYPGVLSALGLLMADVVHETSHAVLASAEALTGDPRPLQELLDRLVAQVRTVLAQEGIPDPRLEASLDMRYRGQSYELTVPVALPLTGPGLATALADFHPTHARRYGYAMPEEPVEIVTLRVRGTGPGARPRFRPEPLGPPTPPAEACLATRPVWFHPHGPTETPGYRREALQPGNRIAGPAIVFQFDTTILVAPGWNAHVDAWRNLWLERA